jgi:hypothetical protein
MLENMLLNVYINLINYLKKRNSYFKNPLIDYYTL